MKWIRGEGLLLFVVAVAGCAGADVFADKELKNKTGVPLYMAKPYLLVKRTGATASPVSVDVIYLPDLEHPHYAAQRSGIGKAKLTVKMTDGMLTEFVADADSKATEFTGAVTAGLKSIAEALKIQRETELLRAEARRGRIREELGGRLAGLADEVSAEAEGDARTAAKNLGNRLRHQAKMLRDPGSRGNEQRVAAALERELDDLKDLQGARAAAWREELRGIIRELRALDRLARAEATFELYEFRMQDGETTLVRVAVPSPPTGAGRVPTSSS
jgi:hypothetical protein